MFRLIGVTSPLHSQQIRLRWAPMSDICIRLAQLSDRDQLVRMREALWPKSSADEHTLELALILEGKAPVTMPLIILVAEASDRALAGFLEIDLRSHADGCNPSRPDFLRTGDMPDLPERVTLSGPKFAVPDFPAPAAK